MIIVISPVSNTINTACRALQVHHYHYVICPDSTHPLTTPAQPTICSVQIGHNTEKTVISQYRDPHTLADTPPPLAVCNAEGPTLLPHQTNLSSLHRHMLLFYTIDPTTPPVFQHAVQCYTAATF